MVIEVTFGGAGTSPHLREADVFESLAVHAARPIPDWAGLDHALRRAHAGVLGDNHAWLEIAWLIAVAGERDRLWHSRFKSMIDYAGTRGWLSSCGRRVRAHIVWKGDR